MRWDVLLISMGITLNMSKTHHNSSQKRSCTQNLLTATECQALGCRSGRFICKEVHLQNRPPMRWDVLSINVGITPNTASIPEAGEHTIPIKPVSKYVLWCVSAHLD